MKALDPRSAEMLEEAVSLIGDTPNRRAMIQKVYDLGRSDGGLEQFAKVRKTFDAELGAEATVSQPSKVKA